MKRQIDFAFWIMFGAWLLMGAAFLRTNSNLKQATQKNVNAVNSVCDYSASIVDGEAEKACGYVQDATGIRYVCPRAICEKKVSIPLLDHVKGADVKMIEDVLDNENN